MTIWNFVVTHPTPPIHPRGRKRETLENHMNQYFLSVGQAFQPAIHSLNKPNTTGADRGIGFLLMNDLMASVFQYQPSCPSEPIPSLAIYGDISVNNQASSLCIYHLQRMIGFLIGCAKHTLQESVLIIVLDEDVAVVTVRKRSKPRACLAAGRPWVALVNDFRRRGWGFQACNFVFVRRVKSG